MASRGEESGVCKTQNLVTCSIFKGYEVKISFFETSSNILTTARPAVISSFLSADSGWVKKKNTTKLSPKNFDSSRHGISYCTYHHSHRTRTGITIRRFTSSAVISPVVKYRIPHLKAKPSQCLCHQDLRYMVPP